MKILKKISIILIIISTLISGFIYITPVQATTEPNFTINSQSAILIEPVSGEILYQKDIHKKLYPASTTKILTAIIAIENCKPTDKITASYEAVMSLPSGYSNAAIQPGETIVFKDLLDMFLIQSANEIGTIFAEHISGNVENFAVLMNKKAKELGCKNTNFTNPSGIHDENHYTTAYDLSLIAKYCMQNETFRQTVCKRNCTIEPTEKYEKRFFRNTNDLLNPSSKYYYEYTIGIKTGYTNQAKRCLISSAKKGDLELIAVTLGAEATIDDKRYEDTVNLFEYGFKNYKIEKIAVKDTIIKDLVIENATKETENLSLLIKNDITGIVPSKTNVATLDYSVQLSNLIAAPIKEGDVLGKIVYNIDGFEYSSDLVANHSVEEFDAIDMLKKIGFALLVLFILASLILPKKNKKNKKKSKSKKGNYKNKKSNTKKRKYNKRSADSIYKF